MKIASFNLGNMFSRVCAMNLGNWEAGKEILADYSKLNTLLQKAHYSAADKQEILDAVHRLGLDGGDETPFVILRQNRGRLLSRPQGAPPVVAAHGRADWIGWLELKTEPVDEIASQMTAKVIKDVGADILAVIEVEDRVALTRFNEQLLKPLNAAYHGAMLIDGNDERGIDVGIYTRPGFTIQSMVSHVDDMDDGKRIFSRDCPEFYISVNGNAQLIVLVNHFRSKGYGSYREANARRKAQAAQVRKIYQSLRQQGYTRIAIAGDLNDTPDSDPLEPLLADGSDLQDISAHPKFQSDGRPGTFKNGTKSQKLDYLLLSPALFGKVTAGGIFREGVWGGVHGTLFPHYKAMKLPIHAASDHAAIWADIDL